MNTPRLSSLSDVPEETSPTGSANLSIHHGSPRSPYTHHAGSPSTSTLSSTTSASASRTPTGPRKPSSLRSSSGAERSPRISEPNGTSSGSSRRSNTPGRDRERERTRDGRSTHSVKVPNTPTLGAQPRIRHNPQMPHWKDAPVTPATHMYWSRAPVHGTLPSRNMRSHSATLVDNLVWVFGGCDEQGCWSDMYTFDVETMMWSHPDMLGDSPPPCRAHTATLVDRKIVVIGGGQGADYYDTTYVFDVPTRTWTKPKLPRGPDQPNPAPRRAHTAVLYEGKIWVFGGGNGLTALNDVWTLDVSAGVEHMRWEKIETHGKRPAPRGYQTANLVGSTMIVVGGSDGKECFSDIWCLDLDTRCWSLVKIEEAHRRLGHTATTAGSFLFIMGGHDGNKYSNELLLFNLASTLQYESKPTQGRPPSPRGYHAAVMADSRLFVFGGFNGHEVWDEVYILDLAAAAYLPQVTSFKIELP